MKASQVGKGRIGDSEIRKAARKYGACERKTSYTVIEADAMVIEKRNQGVNLRVYRCPYCSSYHVTSRF